MPIQDYNASAALNLLLGTIPVGPGMEREKVNNAFQQIMADVSVLSSVLGGVWAENFMTKPVVGDQTVAFQAAIDSLPATGGTVRFRGDYIIGTTNPIRLPAEPKVIYLLGEGRSFLRQGAADAPMIAKIAGVSRIIGAHIKGFVLVAHVSSLKATATNILINIAGFDWSDIDVEYQSNAVNTATNGRAYAVIAGHANGIPCYNNKIRLKMAQTAGPAKGVWLHNGGGSALNNANVNTVTVWTYALGGCDIAVDAADSTQTLVHNSLFEDCLGMTGVKAGNFTTTRDNWFELIATAINYGIGASTVANDCVSICDQFSGVNTNVVHSQVASRPKAYSPLLGALSFVNESAVATVGYLTDARAIDAKNAGATGNGVTDDTLALQRAMTWAGQLGVDLKIGAGRYLTSASLSPPKGVRISGDAMPTYGFSGINTFSGTWIVYRGAVANAAVRFYSVTDCIMERIGIDCGEVANSVAILAASNNSPATKSITVENFSIFGAGIGVKWGDAGAANALEQVDEMTFRNGTFNSCQKGFVINAPNAADFSIIERMSFNNSAVCAFELISPGFLRIDRCAAGALTVAHTMFIISGLSPDPIQIIGCQSEGAAGKFLTYNATNDQGIVELTGNVVNQAIEITGVTRVVSRNNYYNSLLTTSGFVRFSSYDDSWDIGKESEKIIIGGGGQVNIQSLPNADSYNGYFLPVGFKVINGIPTAGGFDGQVTVRKGVRCNTFIASTAYLLNQYVQPITDNTYGYKVTTAGTSGASEPVWPTGIGSTVVSGTVTFTRIVQNAILKGYGAIAA